MNSDDYNFETVLGNGTFGMVHLVRRKSDWKPFVIKEQKLSATNFLSFKMALIEVDSIRKLRHPNIVSYRGAWLEGKRSFILMEFARHGTLKDLLEKRQRPLKEEDAVYLFTQVVLGVNHIHSKNILHRDLKPENIMLTGRNADVVKIVDFGLSKNNQESILSHAGTYFYMAPEMLQGQAYDLKCDIWSMGVVLYEMVTKTLPFPATTHSELMKMVIFEKPKSLTKGLSGNLISTISKMLRKTAISRPSTELLISSPCLNKIVVKLYLNVGRTHPVSKEELAPQVFLNFLKPQSASVPKTV
ncbi:serine/threonine-protein kinase Nek5-like [Leptopilina heterotoma]|uniref:serine/threonine-protein kinase Nek5-like n=1 Tax=Leptopilina heterotoma TaxID=63436 RepID=UPI001CA8C447|nr:serine/threonine-protein kinase Nek5-like [Leptopilina heterotoma]